MPEYYPEDHVRRRRPNLRLIYQELRAAARHTRTDQRRDLRNGARLTVRVRDGIETVTFSRQGAPLGDTEEATFKRYCSVPAGAERLPATGQHTRTEQAIFCWTWHLVAYRWEVAEQQALFAREAAATEGEAG